MDDFLSFKTMAAPVLVKICFWLGTIISFGAGVTTLAGIQGGRLASSGTALVIALTFFVAWPLALRVVCEFVLIVFQIYSTLEEIRKNNVS